jgi:hypothetical protein
LKDFVVRQTFEPGGIRALEVDEWLAIPDALDDCVGPDRRPQGIGCSLSGLAQFLSRALEPVPELGAGFTERNGRFLNPALLVLQVFSNFRLMVQTESDRAVDLSQFQRRKTLLDWLGRIPTLERVLD